MQPIIQKKISLSLELPDIPSEVYAQGTEEALSLVQRLPSQGFAVVGTRRPQARTEALVRKTLLELRGSNLIVISGLALGVDSCAHQAALDVGLPTVAIVGTGLNLHYPRENQELRNRILDANGLLISEYPENTPAKPFHFLHRNRLIAALSQAVWIAQAPERSGALRTATKAIDYGRDCYATPCFPGDLPFAGNQELLDRSGIYPFWGSPSLGITWHELNSTNLNWREGPSFSKTQLTDALWIELKQRTAHQGGATVNDLLSWALEQRISPQDFFERLQNSLQSGLVSESKGILSCL